jgi:AefR-like transcriptional repressor, C-terminal domain
VGGDAAVVSLDDRAGSSAAWARRRRGPPAAPPAPPIPAEVDGFLFDDGFLFVDGVEIRRVVEMPADTTQRRNTEEWIRQTLFAGAVLETVDRGYEYFKPLNEALARVDGDRLEDALRQHARVALTGIMTLEILRLRRLVIAEAERFPELGRQYYERSWVRTQAVLAESFTA